LLTGLARLAFVVEMVLCLAVPLALLSAAAIMLPILLIALPSDMAGSPSPWTPALLVAQLALGVGGGLAGLYAIFQCVRRILGGRPPRTGRAALRLMLLAGIAALVLAAVMTGAGNPKAWALLLALPGAFLAHLVFLSRDDPTPPETAGRP
jgi:peptidoglycan/LPS O-acetylase OafA/YrhL